MDTVETESLSQLSEALWAEKCFLGEKATKPTKMRDLMFGSSWGVAQSMRADETNRYFWSLFDLELNPVRSGRKTEKFRFSVKISADGLVYFQNRQSD